MADGGFQLELDAELGERLTAAAGAVGRSAAEFAADLIAKGLDDGWEESLARLAEYDRTGEYVDADVALRHFREVLAERLKARGV
jgi:hypothetical protein